jgi:glutathione S-transferase
VPIHTQPSPSHPAHPCSTPLLHPPALQDFYASHKGQEEASQPYIEQYGTKRLPRYMRYIDTLLQRAGGSGHLIAGQLTAADLAVYHFLAAAQQHYGQYYDQVEDAPLAKAFKDSMAARPRIAAYLASDRCPPWDKDSMM